MAPPPPRGPIIASPGDSDRERLVRVETMVGQISAAVDRLETVVEGVRQDLIPLKAKTAAITRGLWLVAGALITAGVSVVVAFVVNGGLKISGHL